MLHKQFHLVVLLTGLLTYPVLFRGSGNDIVALTAQFSFADCKLYYECDVEHSSQGYDNHCHDLVLGADRMH